MKKYNEISIFLNPRKEFKKDKNEIEVRFDNLTGIVSRINKMRLYRPKQKIEKIEYRPDYCPFCPNNIEKDTPKFPEEYVKEGRIKCGNAIVFPNLYPLAGLHGVCVFTPYHKITEINEKEILDGLEASLEFFSLGKRIGLPYHFLGWNHLSSAGASIVHPHFQLICSKKGLNYERILFKASKKYWKRKKRSYWNDLLKYSNRYIGETEGMFWIAPWAPMGNFEVIGINTKGYSSINREVLKGIVDGIVRILKSYWEMGINSINMGIFSYPEQCDWFSFHVRIMARLDMPNDRGFLEIYCGEIGISTPPEVYAEHIRKFFK
ncbi:MAG: hypothetical protein QXW62_06290 [Candidatus Methanomethylicaceae archaeon]|nr:hypothetical protein [Candidatus Verstraetearchaeota archaeon]